MKQKFFDKEISQNCNILSFNTLQKVFLEHVLDVLDRFFGIFRAAEQVAVSGGFY